MMHQDNFVVSVKSDGKFLRDEHGVVKIPFDSEYALYLKNLDSRPAVVKVSIDGEDVLNSQQLIVAGNAHLLLEGFLKGLVATRKFKFIELTKEVEENLGYSPEDSIIRVEIQYQKRKPQTQEIQRVYRDRYRDWWIYPYPYTYYDPNPQYTLTWNDSSGIHSYSGGNSCGVVSLDSVNCTYSVNSESYSYTSDIGKTVKGENCDQQFQQGYLGDLEEQSEVLTLRLSGYRDDNKKVEAITTKTDKIYCSQCGKANGLDNKFCPVCGTKLEV